MDNLPATGNIDGLDISRYDWTIDYNARLVTPNRNGVEVKVQKYKDENPSSARVSSTRFMKYGKVSVYLMAPAVPGIVTTFITMGPQLKDSRFDIKPNTDGGDEIVFN